MKPYVRTKQRPPKGTRCDCHVGVSSGHEPSVLRCTELATVELKGGALSWETWACESCAAKLEAKGTP